MGAVSKEISRRVFLGAVAATLLEACRREWPIPTTPREPSSPIKPTEQQSTKPPPETTEPSPTSGEKKLPSEVLNLDEWKLQTSYESPKEPGKFMEVYQPALNAYVSEDFAGIVTEEENAVRFRTPVNGFTTENSKYPRTELREMAKGGTEEASWSSTEGTHTMFIDQVITALPLGDKPELVAGQIHDENDDVIVIRLEGNTLYVNVDGENVLVLDPEYQLGKRFTIKFEVSEGQTRVYYNGSKTPIFILDKEYFGAYFKAGAYPQSNCDTVGSPKLCNKKNIGEVVIRKLKVTHQY